MIWNTLCRIGRFLHRTFWFVNTSVLCLSVVIAILTFGVLGYTHTRGERIFIVKGPSMEPTYSIGDALVVRRVNAATLDVGDVITFRSLSNGVVVTHRIVAADRSNENTVFHTKGDNNATQDAFLTPSFTVLGTPVHTIPFLGRVIGATASAWGRLYLLGIPLLTLMIDQLRVVLRLVSKQRGTIMPQPSELSM